MVLRGEHCSLRNDHRAMGLDFKVLVMKDVVNSFGPAIRKACGFSSVSMGIVEAVGYQELERLALRFKVEVAANDSALVFPSPMAVVREEMFELAVTPLLNKVVGGGRPFEMGIDDCNGLLIKEDMEYQRDMP